MVALSGDDVPATTPVVCAAQMRRRTTILLLLGFLSFVAAFLSPFPWSGEVKDGRDTTPEVHAPVILTGGPNLLTLGSSLAVE